MGVCCINNCCINKKRVHAVQAMLGNTGSSRKQVQMLDEVFAGQQSRIVVNRVVLVIDNFDKLAAQCKEVSSFMALDGTT